MKNFTILISGANAPDSNYPTSFQFQAHAVQMRTDLADGKDKLLCVLTTVDGKDFVIGTFVWAKVIGWYETDKIGMTKTANAA